MTKRRQVPGLWLWLLTTRDCRSALLIVWAPDLEKHMRSIGALHRPPVLLVFMTWFDPLTRTKRTDMFAAGPFRSRAQSTARIRLSMKMSSTSDTPLFTSEQKEKNSCWVTTGTIDNNQWIRFWCFISYRMAAAWRSDCHVQGWSTELEDCCLCIIWPSAACRFPGGQQQECDSCILHKIVML